MRKLLLKLLACMLIVCTFMAGLVACSSSTEWTKPTLTDWGTGSIYGGFMGETDNYIYFINGMASNTSDNTFGAPVKGALMVQDKSDLSKAPQVVVPKLFVATDYNAGLYVYGGRAYYGTPSTDKNSSGAIANSEMTFMSTKLDGTDSVSYFTIPSLSTEYRIVENDGVVYIVYYKSAESALYSYNTTTKTETLIAKTDAKAEGENAVSLNTYKFLDGDAVKNGYAVVYTVTIYDEEYYESAAESSDYSRATKRYNKVLLYKAGGEKAEGDVILDGSEKEITYALTLVKGNHVYLSETDIFSTVVNKRYNIADATDYKKVVNADLVTATNYIYGDNVLTLSEGVITLRYLLEDDKATQRKIAIVSTASSIVYYDQAEEYVYYYNSSNNLARIKVLDQDAKEERISEDTVATTWYDPLFITVGEKDYVFYLDNSAKGASYVKYVDLDGEIKAKDTDDNDEDDLFYLEGHKFLAQRLDADIAAGVASTINAIANDLNSNALVFEEGADGKLTVKAVVEAKALFDAQTDAVKAEISEETVQTLNDYISAINWANEYNKLKAAKNLYSLSEQERQDLEATYNQIKADIEAFRKTENYVDVRDLLGNDLNKYYQDCVKAFEEE